MSGDAIRGVGFLLVAVGTVGLLMNEFILEWGQAATLAFALANVVGLVAIGYGWLRDRSIHS